MHVRIYVICENLASQQFLFMHFVSQVSLNGLLMLTELTTYELLYCSCICTLESVFSNGSSLFSSKRCVSFTLSLPFLNYEGRYA